MPFRGGSPYGTDSDSDNLTLEQSPADVRIAVNGTHIAYLVVNGPISVRSREQIEQIVRVLNRRGLDDGSPIAVAILVRENGAVIDTDASDIDFTDGILVEYISPGVIRVKIPVSGVETAMIKDKAVTPAKLDRTYSEPGHTHTGYALTSHTHTGYATTSHSHSEYAAATHYHNTLQTLFGSFTHRVTAGVSLRIAPGYEHNVIGSISTNHRVKWLGQSGVGSGGDTWHFVWCENWGLGWLPWHSIATL
jgi:hypothetical protein